MEETLKQEILETSNRLNEMSGANATEFIIHCRKSVKKVIGDGFELADYSYEVISTNELLETQNKDGSFQSDIWVTIKPPNKACRRRVPRRGAKVVKSKSKVKELT